MREIFEAVLSDAPAVTTIRVSGEADLATTHSIEDAVEAAVTKRKPIVVDLTDVTFIDVSVVRTLLLSKRQAEDRSLAWQTVVPDGHIAGVLEMLDVLEVLEVEVATDHAG